MTACSTPWQLGTVCSFYSVAHSFGIHMYMVTTLVISVCFWCFLLFHLFLVCFVMLFNQTEIAQKGTHMACCYHWFDRNKTHRLTLSFFFFFFHLSLKLLLVRLKYLPSGFPSLSNADALALSAGSAGILLCPSLMLSGSRLHPGLNPIYCFHFDNKSYLNAEVPPPPHKMTEFDPWSREIMNLSSGGVDRGQTTQCFPRAS